MADVFTQGDAYERFMGRWSRLVAPRFLEWLGSGSGVAVGRRRLRHRCAERGRAGA